MSSDDGIEFVDWTNVTSKLLLSRVPEEQRPEIAKWLRVYQGDVRAATLREAERAIDSVRAAMGVDDVLRRGAAFASGVVQALHRPGSDASKEPPDGA